MWRRHGLLMVWLVPGLLLAVGTAAQSPGRITLDTSHRTLTVETEATTTAPADVMYVLSTISDTNPVASLALHRNQEHIRNLMTALRALGDPITAINASCPDFDDDTGEGGYDEDGFGVTSDILVTLDVSGAARLKAAQELLPRIMDLIASCRGVPKTAFADPG